MRKLLLLIIIFGCSSSREERLIEQSIEVHESALKVGLSISEKITKIQSSTKELDEPLRTVIKDSIEVLMTDWKEWEDSIVEVPGHEHDHHDHHAHDHNHDPSPDLTPKMVLEVQQDLKKRALSLCVRAQKILEKINEEK